jgi:hypothetical protein
MYLWLPADEWTPTVVYDPTTGAGSGAAVLGVAGVLVSTTVLYGSLTVLRTRWPLAPVGTSLMVGGLVAGFTAVGFDRSLVGLPGVVLAMVAADLLAPRIQWPRAAAISSGLLWLGYLVAVDQSAPLGIGWPPEVVGGAVFFGIATAWAVASVPLSLRPHRAREQPELVSTI